MKAEHLIFAGVIAIIIMGAIIGIFIADQRERGMIITMKKEKKRKPSGGPSPGGQIQPGVNNKRAEASTGRPRRLAGE